MSPSPSPRPPRVVSVSSDNALTAARREGRAKEGDTVSVRLEFAEEVVAPTGVILGRVATVAGASPGRAFVASVRVDQDAPTGTAAFNIAFRDAAGNVGGAVTAATDGTQVVVDMTPLRDMVSILIRGVLYINYKKGTFL